MLKSTRGCRLKANAPTIMRAVGSTGLTTGRIGQDAAMGTRDSSSLPRKPLPAYKRTAGKNNGVKLTAKQARALRMRGE